MKPGRLADIAPTILAIMGMEKPAAMTGVSLLDVATRDAVDTDHKAAARV
jgi:2,3-bisphosphoglycerate-independent phosphoglycerate mutase